ncbi:hypothetical protein DXG01_010761 [Tephrocybe rancida]|nr:hypothetical protein DXG01_010761 [Tephrocybe rancida]
MSVNLPPGGTLNAPDDGTPLIHSATEPPPHLPWPDISSRAKWSVSSFKFGFGAECLRDDDPDTFWHSDGPQPHFITAEFPRKVAIQKISIHLSFPQDDSYTPSALAIRAGTGPSDLQDVRVVTLDKPEGWITFDVTSEPNEEGDGLAPVYAYVLQVIIAQNHMSGKDTHVRGLKILGPVEDHATEDDPFAFTSPAFKMYETISGTPSLTQPDTPVFDSEKLDDDDNEHTLCGFGDISLSNIYFVPSLPSDVSPRRDDSWITERKILEPKTPPPSVRKKKSAINTNTKPALPSVIQKILPPSPSAAELSPGTDFLRLVARLRESRILDRSPPQSARVLASPSKPIGIHQPQPRHAINKKAIDMDNLHAKAHSEDYSAKERMLQPSARMNAPKPKPKEKPFRGGRLPVRPPLPRWDLHDPVTATIKDTAPMSRA